MASVTRIAALFFTERFTVQPVATSVIVEREAELPEAVAALVADEVDLDKAGAGIVPLRPGPYRDLGLEEGPGLGVAATPGDEQAGPARRRSMVAGAHRMSSVASVSLRSSPPSRRSPRTRTTSIGARRLPAG